MSVPMRPMRPIRKDALDEDITAELTTADLVQGMRPVSSPVASEDRARAFPVEGPVAELVPGAVLDAPSEAGDAKDSTSLIPNDELDGLRNRWTEVQTGFVDEPRRAVEQADGLVASAMKRLAEVFAEERSRLEKQWDRGDRVSTEDLRLALQRYRSFFQRLLSV